MQIGEFSKACWSWWGVLNHKETDQRYRTRWANSCTSGLFTIQVHTLVPHVQSLSRSTQQHCNEAAEGILNGAVRLLLLVPSYRRSTIGRRAFPIAGARVWNDLPSDVTSARSLAVFGRRLKTELFRRCYNAAWLFLTLIVVLKWTFYLGHSKYYVWWWWWCWCCRLNGKQTQFRITAADVAAAATSTALLWVTLQEALYTDTTRQWC